MYLRCFLAYIKSQVSQMANSEEARTSNQDWHLFSMRGLFDFYSLFLIAKP